MPKPSHTQRLIRQFSEQYGSRAIPRQTGKVSDKNKVRVFVSHISDESQLAETFKKHLLADFAGLLQVDVSSDATTIDAGTEWLPAIQRKLGRAALELVLCSKASVGRPWINFEAGAGWLRKIPVIPVCHSGLSPSELPMPLHALHAIVASDIPGLKRLYKSLTKAIQLEIPSADVSDLVAVDYAKIVESVKDFERLYSVRLGEATRNQLDQRTAAAHRRMKEALMEKRFSARSVSKLAAKAGVTMSEALDILRLDDDVILDTSAKFGRMAKLKSRLSESQSNTSEK